MIKLLSHQESFRVRGHNKTLTGAFLNQLADNTKSAISYYRRATSSVRGNHILVKFINSILTPISLPRERYIEHVETECMMMAKALGIGNATSEPVLHKRGYFYGIPELLIGTVDYPTKKGINNPVKVVMHPRTDITYTLLDGEPNTTEQGLAVISIDLVALMCLYRTWRRQQLLKSPDEALGPVHFVKMIIMPMMISSHNSVAIINRLKANLLGRYHADHIKRTPFGLPLTLSYEKRYMEYILGKLETNQYKFEEILSLTEVSSEEDLGTFTDLPAVPPTRTGKLMKLLVAIPAIEYLLMATNTNPNGRASTNAGHVIELSYFLRLMGNERWVKDRKLSKILDKIINDDVLSLI